MHSLSNWTLAVLLILTSSGFRFVKAKMIGVSVITMQMGKPNKQWTDQNGLSLNPYFSFNPLCHRLLVVLKSVNNDLKDSVLGCRNQTGSGAEITMSIYIALSPTGLQLDSQNKCIRAERKKLLNEWKEAVSQNFEISSNLIHVQLEKKTFYIQAQNMHAYLLQEGSTFSSWFYSWKIKYQEAVCTTMTHLLNKLDKLYPFIHITMETKKGSVYLYVDIDLLFDVTEIGEMKTGDVVSLSNTESARYKQKLTLGSFEYQAPKHLDIRETLPTLCDLEDGNDEELGTNAKLPLGADDAAEDVDENELEPEHGADEDLDSEEIIDETIENPLLKTNERPDVVATNIGSDSFSSQRNPSPESNDRSTPSPDETTNTSGKFKEGTRNAFISLIVVLNCSLLR